MIDRTTRTRTARRTAMAACIVLAGLAAHAARAAPENAAAPDGAREFDRRGNATGKGRGNGIRIPNVDSPYVPSIAIPASDDPAAGSGVGEGSDGREGSGVRATVVPPGKADIAGADGALPPRDPIAGESCIAAPVETASFVEEFDLPLDVSAWGPGTRWIAHTPWNGDFGEARFRDPGENGPFTVQHGILTIEARRNAEGEWGSGLLASVDREGRGFAQLYGYFEARAKLPAVPGVWPAFWLIGRDRSSFTAEIDVMEYRGAKPDGYTSSLHVWNRGGRPHDKQLERHVVFDGGNHADRFNTYGVHVGPERTTFYFNRCPVWTARTRREHRQPMYLLVNLALGGSFPIDETPSPTSMEVDYVRVWPLGAVSEQIAGR